MAPKTVVIFWVGASLGDAMIQSSDHARGGIGNPEGEKASPTAEEFLLDADPQRVLHQKRPRRATLRALEKAG